VSFTRIRCWNRSASLHKTSTLQHRIDSSNNCPATCRALRGFAIVGFPFRTQKRICYSVACDKERSCCARKIDWPAEYDFAERKKGRRCFWILNALRQRDKERRIDMNFAALQYTLPSYPIKARRSSLFDFRQRRVKDFNRMSVRFSIACGFESINFILPAKLHESRPARSNFDVRIRGKRQYRAISQW